jgi:hypothetical protein
MQEVFLSIDPRREPNWADSIRNFCAIFKPFMMSDGIEYQGNVDPRFLAWARDAVKDFEHPVARRSP